MTPPLSSTGSVDDVASSAYSMHTADGRYDLVQRTPEFYRGTSFLMLGGRLVKLDVPEDAEIARFLQGPDAGHSPVGLGPGGATFPEAPCWPWISTPFSPASATSKCSSSPKRGFLLGRLRTTRNTLLFTTLDNVRGRLYRLTLADGEWQREEIALPGLGTVGIGSTSEVDDSFFFYYTGFLTPSSLYFVPDGGEPTVVKCSPVVVRPRGHERRAVRGRFL